MLGTGEIKSERRHERVAEADVDEVRMVQFDLEGQVVDEHGRSLQEHRSPQAPDAKAQLLQQPGKGPIVLEAPASPSVDEFGQGDVDVGRDRDTPDHIEVLERHGDQMGVLERLQGVETGIGRALVTQPLQVGVDVGHPVTGRSCDTSR